VNNVGWAYIKVKENTIKPNVITPKRGLKILLIPIAKGTLQPYDIPIAEVERFH
jgi:hypothetical protein